MQRLYTQYAHQPKFLQAVTEVHSLIKECLLDPRYQRAFDVLVEPEKVIGFKIIWEDDMHQMRMNRGWHVQFNSALGPYKGGLRFHPAVNEGTLKFLAFEQIFKNALTGLPMGGGKGGSDFDPKGKSDGEIRRFCQAFMTELHRHAGPIIDVLAGDIGVGQREIGYMFGQCKRLANTGTLTGKGELCGMVRSEATGYGAVYIARLALQDIGLEMNSMRCIVSGSGNVAQYCAEKLIHLGAKPITFSDSDGTLYKEQGFDIKDLETLMRWKNSTRGRLNNISITQATFVPVQPWELDLDAIDLAFPCATENEIDEDAARKLVDSGCVGCFEGANMPVTIGAQTILKRSMIYIPGKAANAGGVAVSGFEMSHSIRDSWDHETVDRRLETTMASIYQQTKEYGGRDLEKGATVAGFIKIARAMAQLGSC